MTITEPSTSKAAVELVTLTIDGVEVQVPKGTLVIRAAEQIGTQIPRFCDHPLLAPVGASPAVHRGGRGPAQAGRLLHDPGRRGHGGPHPGLLAGRREGAARRDGAAADQPPAGLPGLRQGRRVPAAEPGDVHRRRRLPLRRHEADLPEAGADQQPGAAGPRALRALRPLHPVLPGDHRRPVHRPGRARRARAGRHRRGRRLPVVLLGQHHPDLPGRRPHLGRLPVPLAALRPGLLAERLRALLVRLRAAHRPPARQGAAAPGRARTRR